MAKTLIVGAGAIGGVLGVLMNRSGYRVDFLEVAPGAAAEIRKNGFRLSGAKGNAWVFPKVYSSADEINETYDFVIIAVKYLHLQAAAKGILHTLRPDSLVVGMQNGICTDELAAVVGRERTVGCMIGFGATKLGDNRVEMTSDGEMYIGMADGGCPPQLKKLREMYNCVVKTKIAPAILPRQFSKLIINCCINATAAITGETLGVILDDRRAQDLFLAIAREGMAVADAMQISVPKYGLLLDYRLLRLSDSDWYNAVCQAVIRMVGKGKYAKVKPSTLQSLLRGEKTEIDIFNGWLAAKGAELGVDVPVNRALTAMIRDIENGRLGMGPDNLDLIAQYAQNTAV